MIRIPLLARTPGFIAIDKPPGTLVIPGRVAGKELSLRERLEQQLGQKLFVVHRLDRDTSGALLFALTAVAHRALSMAFENGEVEKHYLALVRGRLQAPVEVDIPLSQARRGRMRRAPRGQGKPAITRIRPVEVFERATLVDVEPLTGRTHQIRVHLLEAGHPLLVDPQYGQPEVLLGSELGNRSNNAVLERTPLHARRLNLPPLPGIEASTIEAPLAQDMSRALELLRRGSGAHAERIG